MASLRRLPLTSLALALAAACTHEKPAPAAGPVRAAPAPADEKREPEVTLEFQDSSARTIVQTIAAVTGRTIELDPALERSVTLRVRDMPWREALGLLAERVGGKVVDLEGGRWRVEPLSR